MRHKILYNGLNYQTRKIIDAAAGGLLSNKYQDEAKSLFKDMDNNEPHWSSRGRQPRVVRLHEEDIDIALAAKMDALIEKLDLLMSNSPGASSSSKTILFCETCGGGYRAA